jgi:hypothetical protein
MDVGENILPSTCAIIVGGISATANTCAAARKQGQGHPSNARPIADELARDRGPGDSYSDVILRVAVIWLIRLARGASGRSRSAGSISKKAYPASSAAAKAVGREMLRQRPLPSPPSRDRTRATGPSLVAVGRFWAWAWLAPRRNAREVRKCKYRMKATPDAKSRGASEPHSSSYMEVRPAQVLFSRRSAAFHRVSLSVYVAFRRPQKSKGASPSLARSTTALRRAGLPESPRRPVLRSSVRSIRWRRVLPRL